MEQKQKVQSEKAKRIKKEKQVLHYLIVYLVCLLVACLTWLSVRYSMRAENNNTPTEGSSLSVIASNSDEFPLYV